MGGGSTPLHFEGEMAETFLAMEMVFRLFWYQCCGVGAGLKEPAPTPALIFFQKLSTKLFNFYDPYNFK